MYIYIFVYMYIYLDPPPMNGQSSYRNSIHVYCNTGVFSCDCVK